MKKNINKSYRKLFLLLILTEVLVGCNQDQNNQQQSNLDAPDVVTKKVTKKATAKANQFLSPLRDDSSNQMIIGYNQSINSFATNQCFTYTTTAGQMQSDASLGVAYTSTDIQKKLGIDTSVRMKMATFKVEDKNDINTAYSNFSNSIRVYYTAYVGGTLTNQLTGLTDQGKIFFKEGLPTFASLCGSSYVNKFSGYVYTVFYFDISSSDTKTMEQIKNTAKAKVSFLSLMNTVSSSTSSNNSTVSIQAGISNYGGAVDDAGKIVSITGSLLNSPNLTNCTTDNAKNASACSAFIQNDVGGAIKQIDAIVSSETTQKNYSGLYPDFTSVSNNITQITGAMIAEKKTKTIPDPYINYKLLNAANVAQDLSIAAVNASTLSGIVSQAGNLIPSLQFASAQLTNNAAAYTNAADQIWTSINNCLSGIASCPQVGSPSVVTSLSNQPIALQALYNQAYQISFINTNNVANGVGSVIPLILLNNNNNAYLFSPTQPNYQAGPTGAPGVIEFYQTSNISSINSNLRAGNAINGQILTPTGNPFNFSSANPDNVYTLQPLDCSLLSLVNNSCTAYILPATTAGKYYYDYLTMSVASPFTTVTQAQ